MLGGGREGDLSVRLESKISSPLPSSRCPFAATTRERIVGPPNDISYRLRGVRRAEALMNRRNHPFANGTVYYQ